MSLKETAKAKSGAVVMKLPARVLRRMAGDPVVVDGRTLDVRLQLAAKQAARGPSMTELPVDEARAAASAALAQGNGPRAKGVAVQDRPIGTHGLRVRIYRPAQAEGIRPGMLFMHQGGFVIGDLDSCDTFCSRVADSLGAVVVSLDYRLAPEHRFPAQADDADEAWDWMVANAVGLGIDVSKLVVCGDSAGGQMTASLCQRLRDRGDQQAAVQALVYPYVDATADDGSMVSCADAFPLDQELMDWFEGHYLPDGFDRSDPLLSPALAPNLAGLPPAVVVTAGFDPLRDQGMGFALALRAAGVHVVDRCENSLSHSFLSFPGLVPEAGAAIDRIIADLDALL